MNVKKLVTTLFTLGILFFAPGLLCQTNADNQFWYTSPIGSEFNSQDVWVAGEAWTTNDPNSSVAFVHCTTPGWEDVRWDNVRLNPAGGAKTPLSKKSIFTQVQRNLGNPIARLTQSEYSAGNNSSVTVEFKAEAASQRVACEINTGGIPGSFTAYDPIVSYKVGCCADLGQLYGSYSQTESFASPSIGFTLPFTVRPTERNKTTYYAYIEVRSLTGKTTRAYATINFSQYTVSYDCTGNLKSVAGSSVYSNTSIVAQKEFFASPATISSTQPTASSSSYVFLGWATSLNNAKNEKIEYHPGQKIPARSSNLTLYAVWKAAEAQVRLFANGGKIIVFGIEASGDKYIPFSITAGSDFNFGQLINNASYQYKYDFHKFANRFFYYYNGNKVFLSGLKTVTNKGLSAYVAWDPNKLTVNYYNSSTKLTTQTMTYDDDNVHLNYSPPSKTGHRFIGFSVYQSEAAANAAGAQAAYKSQLLFTRSNSFTQDAYAWALKFGKGTALKSGDASVSLYAQFEPCVYTIELNDNGGGGGNGAIFEKYGDGYYDKNPDSDASAKKITKVTIPTRGGYSFNGYYTQASGGTQTIDASGTIKAGKVYASNQTFYAQWTQNQYSIVYDLNDAGTTKAKLGINSPTSGYYTNTVTIDNPTRDGYLFTGWSVSGACRSALTGSVNTNVTSGLHDKITNRYFKQLASQNKNNETVTFKANWEPIQYKVKLDNNNSSYRTYCSGGFFYTEGSESTHYTSGREMSVKFDGNWFGISNASLRGYAFSGYSLDKNPGAYAQRYSKSGPLAFSGKTLSSDMQFIQTRGDVKSHYTLRNLTAEPKQTFTFKAKWTAQTYEITLNDNGGNGGEGVIYERYQINIREKDSTILLEAGFSPERALTVPERDGYIFDGYFVCTPGVGGLLNYDVKIIDENGMPVTSARFTENGYTYSVGNADYFASNAVLYAKWTKKIFEVEVDAADAKDVNGAPLNEGYYYDYSHALESAEYGSSDGIWYKDSVNARCTAVCNYASITQTKLQFRCEDNGGATDTYQSPSNPSSHRYGVVDKSSMRASIRKNDGKVYVIGSGENDITTLKKYEYKKKDSEQKVYYVDANAPIVYNFSRTFHEDTADYTVSFCISDAQSGIVETKYQTYQDGAWVTLSTTDYRTYDPAYSKNECLQKGYFTTKRDSAAVTMDNLPVCAPDYNRKFRVAVYDAVGHETCTEEFTLAPPLKFTGSIRKIDGTTVPVGEELELYEYGDMNLWIDGKTEGYAEKILYALPKEIHLSSADAAHREADYEEVMSYPMPDAEKDRFRDHFDDFNFYVADVASSLAGHGADTIQLEADSTSLLLNETYQIRAFAIRGGSDFVARKFYVHYKHYQNSKRVIISQSWQAPIRICYNWDWLNLLVYGKTGEQLMEEYRNGR